MSKDDYTEEFWVIDKKTDKPRRLNPNDPSDAELIQEHKDAIRHRHGVTLDYMKKEQPH